MIRTLALATVAVLLAAGPTFASGVSGRYVEARTCDVWTGPCFANAEMNMVGRHAVVGWRVDKGTLDGAKLDGLNVVAVIEATDTLGLKQTGPAKALLIVDKRANKTQRQALIKLARKQGGELVRNVIAVQTAPVDLDICPCSKNGCAILKAGKAEIETRCIDEKHDTVCGNERAYYPPLVRGVKARAAFAQKHSYTGKGLKEIWTDNGCRGAYLGSFTQK